MDTLLLCSIIFAFFVAAVAAAYARGALDPVIGYLAEYMLKAKAEAEVQGLKTEGLKEGQDFLRGDVSGSKQAAEVEDKFGL
ncbi:hypothetical protein TWF718_004629 [Orbilia javanica]|uniref:Uncharacterized protein n=1 Tax=Orbilia javanica TaxID=47235 RepID=A0AAN8MVQ5_9PEZI